MKKLTVFIILVLFSGQIFAQKKITTNIFINPITIKLMDGRQAKGAMYSINDSILTLGNTFDKEKYYDGQYRIYSYPLENIDRINGKKISNLSRIEWVKMMVEFNRWAIEKADKLGCEQEIEEYEFQKLLLIWGLGISQEGERAF